MLEQIIPTETNKTKINKTLRRTGSFVPRIYYPRGVARLLGGCNKPSMLNSLNYRTSFYREVDDCFSGNQTKSIIIRLSLINLPAL